MRKVMVISGLVLTLLLGTGLIQAQAQTQLTARDRLKRSWNAVHKKLLEMAEDFPEEMYTYKPHPDVRTFGEELLHVAHVDAVVAQRAAGRQDSFRTIFREIAPDYRYTSKADTVAKLKKAIKDCQPAVEAEDNSGLIGLLEHAGEHYGKLVIYYRNNGLVPPATRAAQARQRQKQQRQPEQGKE